MKRNDDDKDDDLLNPLSVARKWLPWCLGLILALTLAWTAFVYWYESNRGDHADIYDTIIAVSERVMPSTLPITVISILIVSGFDLAGGVIVVTAKYLGNKFVKPLIEKRRAEGRAEGRAEERLLWSEWNRRREEAEANGVPFAEPPPDRVGENGANGTA